MTVAELPASYPTARRPRRARRRPGSAWAAADAPRLAAFAAFAALVASGWLALIIGPPAGRGVATVAVVLVGAIAMSALMRSAPAGAARSVAAVVIAVAVTVGAMVAIGLPAHLLKPSGWGELERGLRTGLAGAFGAGFPYTGTDPWTRLVILLGLPVILGIASGLAFASGVERRRRWWALAVLVGGWGLAVALRAPADSLLWGLALFACVAGWLWLDRVRRVGAGAAVALLAGAGALALPLASALDRGAPLLDYQNWNISLSSASAQSISYSWDHTYGPLHWSRSGRTLLTVSGTAPQYWRAAVLDRFDGLRWASSAGSGGARFELPARAERVSGVAARINALDPRWVHRAKFSIDDLSSQLVVAPGAVLRLGGLTISSAGPAGLTLPSDETLNSGSTYSVVAYEPDPSPVDLRNAPQRLAPGLRQFTEIGLPRITSSEIATNSLGQALQRGIHPSPTISLRTIEMPLYGRSNDARDRRLLAHSAYGPVYALARRLTAGTTGEYAAVKAIESHLRTNYRYNESPPRRALPLRAFLFRDRIGYCQQFSGAMALMLRSIGIPSRVASGFSPGVPNPHGQGYAVRDLDAHSWVEVYFDGIGWVPFDPTPAAAPAGSQSPGVGGTGVTQGPSRQAAAQPGGPTQVAVRHPVAPSGSSPWPWIALAAALAIAAGAGGIALRRRRRFLALSAEDGAAVQARELGGLVARLGLQGSGALTLLELERRLRTIAGPPAAAYATALRVVRYGAGGGRLPTLAERRVMREAVFSGSGLRARLAGLVAIPPGGPR